MKMIGSRQFHGMTRDDLILPRRRGLCGVEQYPLFQEAMHGVVFFLSFEWE